MELQLYTNNATSTLASGVLTGGVSLTLATGGGAMFSSPTGGKWQMLTLTDGVTAEVVKLTARSGDVLTVVRAQEGTTATAWSGGIKVEARVTAGMLGRFPANTNDHVDGGLALFTGFAADTPYSVALGQEAVASGQGSVAIGHRVTADMDGGVAIGSNSARAYRAYQFASFALPCIPRDEYWATYGAQYNSGQESTWASHYVDLGTPQTWAGTTVYTEGAVVQPSTPNGFQYRLYHGTFNSAVLNTVTSEATEPTWPTPAAVEDSVEADGTGDHWWIASDLALGTDEVIPAGMVFYPTEVGFICFNHSGVSAAPYVSIGTVADPTLLVSNQQLTSITGAAQRHAFTGLKHGITDLRCKLITPATGASARFHGRFYAKGMFIQTQG